MYIADNTAANEDVLDRALDVRSMISIFSLKTSYPHTAHHR